MNKGRTACDSEDGRRRRKGRKYAALQVGRAQTPLRDMHGAVRIRGSLDRTTGYGTEERCPALPEGGAQRNIIRCNAKREGPSFATLPFNIVNCAAWARRSLAAPRSPPVGWRQTAPAAPMSNAACTHPHDVTPYYSLCCLPHHPHPSPVCFAFLLFPDPFIFPPPSSHLFITISFLPVFLFSSPIWNY